jgi:hypothetical protein
MATSVDPAGVASSSAAATGTNTSSVSLRSTQTGLTTSSASVVSSKFIDRIQAKIQAKQPFFSFEYFPPKTADGLTNLYMRFDRMGALGPVRLRFATPFLSLNRIRSIMNIRIAPDEVRRLVEGEWNLPSLCAPCYISQAPSWTWKY